MAFRNDVRAFQRAHGLKVDGKVGPNTWGAAIAAGGDYMPSRPPFRPLTQAQAKRLFGNPTRGVTFAAEDRRFKPNAAWKRENIIAVELDHPLPNGRSRIWLHRLAAEPFVRMWNGWNMAGVVPGTFHGSIAFRRTRGGTRLSNHAFGTATDWFARNNGFGKTPALLGEPGCLLEAVKIAHANGFYWGGHFRKPDGMHFELAKL